MEGTVYMGHSPMKYYSKVIIISVAFQYVTTNEGALEATC